MSFIGTDSIGPGKQVTLEQNNSQHNRKEKSTVTSSIVALNATSSSSTAADNSVSNIGMQGQQGAAPQLRGKRQGIVLWMNECPFMLTRKLSRDVFPINVLVWGHPDTVMGLEGRNLTSGLISLRIGWRIFYAFKVKIGYILGVELGFLDLMISSDYTFVFFFFFC